MPTTPFIKPPRSPQDLIALLISRGLDIPDTGRAQRHLNSVGYYRFMGYGQHFFDKARQRFFEGTTYEQIWSVYKFDRKLRLLTLDAIERIEVAVRTAVSNSMSMAHGAHWFMEPYVWIFKAYSYQIHLGGSIGTTYQRIPISRHQRYGI